MNINLTLNQNEEVSIYRGPSDGIHVKLQIYFGKESDWRLQKLNANQASDPNMINNVINGMRNLINKSRREGGNIASMLHYGSVDVERPDESEACPEPYEESNQ